jgi:ribonuclease HII
VAAAVVLPRSWIRDGLPGDLAGLNDSKQLTASGRERFFDRLKADPGVSWAIAEADSQEIDQLNILRATHAAMNRALARLAPPPEHALVDGWPVPTLAFPQTALVQGDARSFSIAAASVLAKVTRDRAMLEWDRRYPAYGFARHKGYPTAEHLDALARHGPSPIHRRSFAPVRAAQLELFG